MRINNKIKRGSVVSWAKHTDNVYWGKNRKQVRRGKRLMRKKLNNELRKLIKFD